jgi:hypothetical protein
MNRTNGRVQKISCFKDRKASRGSSKVSKKFRVSNNILDDKDLSHILWWKEVSHFSFFPTELVYLLFYCFDHKPKNLLIKCCFLSKLLQKLEMCKKPSTMNLIERLDYSNLLGMDSNLKNGK